MIAIIRAGQHITTRRVASWPEAERWWEGVRDGLSAALGDLAPASALTLHPEIDEETDEAVILASTRQPAVWRTFIEYLTGWPA